MAEETEGQDIGAEASGGGVDPAAVALALGGASRERADAFLKQQEALIVDQRHHLTEQFKQLRLNIWQQRLGVLLRIATGFVGLAVAAALALMIWDAAHANGLIIEEFSVPPDMASRGISGQVVASQMLDKLTTMQNETIAADVGRSLTSGWGDNINVQIPDTGVSLGEVYRFLREWLGHETHLGGEIYRTESGIAITARTSGDSGTTFTGSEADLDSLVQKSAENVYRKTQPARYDAYLREHDRLAEALATAKVLAETGSNPLDQAAGYSDWAIAAGELHGVDEEIRLYERGEAIGADYPNIWINLGRMEDQTGRPEEAARTWHTALSLVSSHGDELFLANQVPLVKEYVQALLDDETGDYRESSREYADVVQGRLRGYAALPAYLAQAQIGEHELSIARTNNADATPTGTNPAATLRISARARMLFDDATEDWASVLSDAAAFTPSLQKYPGNRTFLPTMMVPLTAYAEARLGKIADAEKLISATPADCYDCLITRARIAELEGQYARADWWFARAVRDAPSIPMAYADWGQSMLDRGDPDGAIAKFTLANQEGPKFSDPLEGWGEALMKKNRSDQALAKFEEADKYAPNWGRLHMKWGEALGYAGKKDEAQKQYAVAAGLDMSAADKAELAKVSHG